VGVVVVVDETGTVLRSTTSLMMDVARDFFGELIAGLNVVTDRDEIEHAIRRRYRGHSQGALVSAMRKVYEAVDQSPIAARRPAAMAARHSAGKAAADAEEPAASAERPTSAKPPAGSERPTPAKPAAG